ncbi:hypothetical protein E1A91_D05G377900v1 [Gossypium mustelinum]|uniref:Zinc finger PHD-type domain-containing protein n=1 Tax=Gossypium mustelinum TaxID=34275 RepID=A0A5D2V607_GOSMU|nr:hypothetical protein E1A91_D05G377900v1 [Gossypium mustelinum]
MDSRFQVLPPLKRFRLLQQQREEDEEFNGSKTNSFPLPAKKRKESRDVPLPETTSYCLPAKKRIWAFQPDFLSGKPLLPFDLNVEYEKQVEMEENKSNPICKTPQKCIFDTRNEIFEKSNKTPFENRPPKCIKTRQEGNKENQIPKKNPLVKSPKSHQKCVNISPTKANKEVEMEEEEEDGILCDICKSTDGDPKDPIVFCDGCDLMVHSTCYGNPLIKEIPEGCVIECSEPKCGLEFHVTCGLNEDLCIEYKEGKKGAVVAGFCKFHTELWKKQQQTGKFKIVARDEHK